MFTNTFSPPNLGVSLSVHRLNSACRFNRWQANSTKGRVALDSSFWADSIWTQYLTDFDRALPRDNLDETLT